MPWPVLAPATIASNAAGLYESVFEDCDARSANSPLTVSCRLIGLTAYDLYLYGAYIGDELMPDTAVDNFPRHAAIWGIAREPAVTATGNLVFTGQVGTTIVAGTVCSYTPTGALYVAQATRAIAAGQTQVSVPFQAATAGVAGDLPPGTVLQLVSPIAGLAAQQGVADASGIADGADLESIASWRGRLLQRIRNPPSGGAKSDYVAWAQSQGAPFVAVVPQWTQANGVGVIIAGPGPSAASPQLIAAVQAYLNRPDIRPVCSAPFVVAATLQPVNASVHLIRDNAQTRAAATAAYNLWFAQAYQPDASGVAALQIGGTLIIEELEAAVQAGSGSPIDWGSPAADVVSGATVLLTPGLLSFT